MTAELHILHMNDDDTIVPLGSPDGALFWKPTPRGLLVRRHDNGTRTVFPWVTVKSYTVVINPEGDRPDSGNAAEGS